MFPQRFFKRFHFDNLDIRNDALFMKYAAEALKRFIV
jgi:hypothetical protein